MGLETAVHVVRSLSSLLPAPRLMTRHSLLLSLSQHESTLTQLISAVQLQALQALEREYDVAERRSRALDAAYVSSRPPKFKREG